MSKTSGFTLLELLLTITISSMVMIYAMTVFTDLGKGFRIQGIKNNSVQTLTLQKKQIEKSLDNIGSIDSWTSTSIRFKELNTDSIIAIQFKNGSLLANGKTICKDLKGLRFDLQENTDNRSSQNNDKVLLWDCLSDKNALICGAVIIRE
ncbi:MAG TPA: prepilin-type N-terminal cleavage/methylation domain-containing protein [Chitinispirillaceae bacterium]|nr:prepilin-type N-terminal cleavage/methylation domain-containing protein [Chitinispirillaceae bacterium]